MSDGRDREGLKKLVSRHEQKVFSLALYLVGGDPNAAYEIASSAFVEAILEAGPSDAILAAAAAKVVEKSRAAKTMPSFDPACLTGVAEREKGVLGVVGRALQALSFNEKALVLLRDQTHLPYRDTARLFGGSDQDARAQTEKARAQLRNNIAGWTQHKDVSTDGM